MTPDTHFEIQLPGDLLRVPLATPRPGDLLRVQILPHRPRDLPLPAYQTEHSAGMDLVASHGASIGPMNRVLVGTGLAFEIPVGCEGQIRPRSGLAANHGVTVLNSPGTIDADYRGELKVLLVNLSQTPFRIEAGDRIAQFVIAPVLRCGLDVVDELQATERGAGGFGSTGVSAKKPG